MKIKIRKIYIKTNYLMVAFAAMQSTNPLNPLQ